MDFSALFVILAAQRAPAQSSLRDHAKACLFELTHWSASFCGLNCLGNNQEDKNFESKSSSVSLKLVPLGSVPYDFEPVGFWDFGN